MSSIRRNFNVQSLAQDIKTEHKDVRKNKTEAKWKCRVNNPNSQQVSGEQGEEITIKLSTQYRKTKFLGIKVRYTQVELLDRNGKSIGNFVFNRGKNLENNIRDALNELNTASTDNSASLDGATNDEKVQQDSNLQGQRTDKTGQSKPSSNYVPLAGLSISPQELQTKLKANEAKRKTEENKQNTSTSESNATPPQATPMAQLNDLQTAMAKVRKNHTQSETQTTTTPNPTSTVNAATKTEKLTDKNEISTPKAEIPADKTAHNVSGTAETTAIDSFVKSIDHLPEKQRKEMEALQPKLKACCDQSSRLSLYVSQLTMSPENAFEIRQPIIKNPKDFENKISAEVGIANNTMKTLSTGNTRKAGLSTGEGGRTFSDPEAMINGLKNAFLDPTVPMSINERKQGIEATISAYKNFIATIDIEADIQKKLKEGNGPSFKPLIENALIDVRGSTQKVSLPPIGKENEKSQRTAAEEWISVLEAAKKDLNDQASALNLGCGAAMASVMQFTDDDWELEKLGQEVEDLRNRFQNQKETPKPIELNFNGQKFTIFASKAKRFKKAGTKITIKGPGNQEASFIFDQGRNLSEKLKISLKSVALQTYIERKPNAQTELKCCYAHQNLNKWSDQDGNGHLMDIQTQLYTKMATPETNPDEKAKMQQAFKDFGGLTTNVGILRDTLKWIESGKEGLGAQADRLYTDPQQTINQIKKGFEAAKAAGMSNKELNSLFEDLQAAANTIAEARHGNDAVKNFADGLAKLTLPEAE